MTGYGYSEINYENAVISVEIKSVNSRFLDLSVNLPPYLNAIESFFRNLIIKNISQLIVLMVSHLDGQLLK